MFLTAADTSEKELLSSREQNWKMHLEMVVLDSDSTWENELLEQSRKGTDSKPAVSVGSWEESLKNFQCCGGGGCEKAAAPGL